MLWSNQSGMINKKIANIILYGILMYIFSIIFAGIIYIFSLPHREKIMIVVVFIFSLKCYIKLTSKVFLNFKEHVISSFLWIFISLSLDSILCFFLGLACLNFDNFFQLFNYFEILLLFLTGYFVKKIRNKRFYISYNTE